MQKFTGKQYLRIDIANNFGLDKKTWTERFDWFQQHKDHLMEMLHFSRACRRLLALGDLETVRKRRRAAARGCGLHSQSHFSRGQALCGLALSLARRRRGT